LVGAAVEQRRQDLLAAPSGTPQEVHLGLDLPVETVDTLIFDGLLELQSRRLAL